jgi:hypothetical protein
MRAALVGAAVFLSTGAGLVAYFLSGLALPLGVGVALVATTGADVAVWRRLNPAQRRVVRARAWAGIRAGAAQRAYDFLNGLGAL